MLAGSAIVLRRKGHLAGDVRASAFAMDYEEGLLPFAVH